MTECAESESLVVLFVEVRFPCSFEGMGDVICQLTY